MTTALLVTLGVCWGAFWRAGLSRAALAIGHSLARREVRRRAGAPRLADGGGQEPRWRRQRLLLGGIGVVSSSTSVTLALVVGVAELGAWGIAVSGASSSACSRPQA